MTATATWRERREAEVADFLAEAEAAGEVRADLDGDWVLVERGGWWWVARRGGDHLHRAMTEWAARRMYRRCREHKTRD